MCPKVPRAAEPSGILGPLESFDMNAPSIVRVATGIVFALLGLALAGGGAWLAALGGSLFYLLAGIGILASGLLLLAKALGGIIAVRCGDDRNHGLGSVRERI